MQSRHNATGEVTIESDGLEIELAYGLFIGDVVVVCKMEYEGYDPGDYWTPPSGGYATMYDIEVKSVGVYDANGDDVDMERVGLDVEGVKRRADKFLRESDWMNQNEDYAAELWSQEAQGAAEAALEAKFDAMREEKLLDRSDW